MILIADSGGTKTDWRLIDKNGEIQQAKTAGIHPVHLGVAEIQKRLKAMFQETGWETPEKVFFYGAGCAEESLAEKVEKGFRKVLGKAVHLEVMHDVLAAARALCGAEGGVACILGTGSSACHFDGAQIATLHPGQGIILGDEGSGAYLGKMLVAAYLNQVLPFDLVEHFEKRYSDRRAEILENVYHKSNPGEYLGQYAQFLLHHLKHPWVYKLVYESFVLFLEKNVQTMLNESLRLPIHFTGRIAFYFSNVLSKAVQDLDMRMGRIMEAPIAGLTLYHQREEGLE